MSRNSAKHAFIAILSLFTIGVALSIGTAKAEDVTEDQILKALAPEKKPLTRSLSMGPPVQANPAAAEAEGKLLQSLRNRSTRSRVVSSEWLRRSFKKNGVLVVQRTP